VERAFDAVGGTVDDGEEHRVCAGGLGDEPGVEIGAGGGDGVGEIAVEALGLWAGDGYVELVVVAGGVKVTVPTFEVSALVGQEIETRGVSRGNEKTARACLRSVANGGTLIHVLFNPPPRALYWL
jgi:hypothetical protein